MPLQLSQQTRTANDFRPTEIVDLQHDQAVFRMLYEGRFGQFFDNNNAGVPQKNGDSNILLSSKTKRALDGTLVMPRAEAFLTEASNSWYKNPIETFNYVSAICEIYSQFILGDGVRVIFEDDSHEDLWKYYAQNQKFDSRIVGTLHESMYAGYSGIHQVVRDGSPNLDRIFSYNYYPDWAFKRGYSHNDIFLHWVFSKEPKLGAKIDSTEYDYVIDYAQKGSRVSGKHTVYKKQAQNRFTTEAEGIFEQELFDPNSNITAEGVEDILSLGVPVYMIESNKRTHSGVGVSLFRDLQGHFQDMTILTAIASDELRKNFKSKVAIPASAVQQKEDGTAQILHEDYFIMGLDAQRPEYVTKDPSFFEPLFKQQWNLRNEIATACNIPASLLQKKESGEQIRVGVAEIDNRPFIKNVVYFQNEMHLLVSRVVRDFFLMIGEGEAKFQVQFENAFEATEEQKREALNDMVDRDIISKKYYLKSTLDLTDDEAEKMLQDWKDEEDKYGVESINLLGDGNPGGGDED